MKKHARYLKIRSNITTRLALFTHRGLLCAVLVVGAGLGGTPQARAGAEPFVGEMMLVGFNFAPRGWAHCDGQLLPISSHTALFSLLGTTYGGDGRTTFALPDLRGRVAMHRGTGPGLTPRLLGQKGGGETVTLNAQQMPNHTHAATTTSTLMATDTAGSTSLPTGNVLAEDGNDRVYGSVAPNVSMNAAAIASTTTVNNTGGGQAHPNMQPYLVVNCVIALQGIFPSRS